MINFSVRVRVLALAFAVGCGGSAHPSGDRPEGRLWVLAPHPDDEVLMAGELLRQSVARGRPVTVVVMTNGDLSCTRNGHARQAETIAALASLGVTEEHVHFLGYPDGWLDALGPVPLDPLPRTQPDGSCGTGDHTYASHGAGGHELHYLLTGSSAPYTAEALIGDLATLLDRERPTEIVTAHGIDTHPDHAMTYVYLRRALELVLQDRDVQVLRSIVHQGPCWPNGDGTEPCPDVHSTQRTPFPTLAPPLDRYVPSMHVASGDHGVAKRAAIALYVSQLEAPSPEQSWLSSFAREDEPFYTESLARDDRDLHRVDRGAHAQRGTGLSEHLSVVADPDGAALVRNGAVIRHWPVPHGEDATIEHEYEITTWSVSPIEVDVRRDGIFWMSAVVPLTAAEPSVSGSGNETTVAQ